jgi:pilus assembly protein Flp/PilA
MIDLAKRFANDESGATAIEYGLIAAGISVAIITVVNSLGSQLKTTFSSACHGREIRAVVCRTTAVLANEVLCNLAAIASKLLRSIQGPIGAF